MLFDDYMDLFEDYRADRWLDFDDEFITTWLNICLKFDEDLTIDYTEDFTERDDFLNTDDMIDNSDNSVPFLDINDADTDLFNSIDLNNTDLCGVNNSDLNLSPAIHTHGWLYGFAENFFAYTYDITYYIFENFIYMEAPYLKYKKYWINTYKGDQYNFFNAIMLDQLYALSVIILPFFNEFCKNFAKAKKFLQHFAKFKNFLQHFA